MKNTDLQTFGLAVLWHMVQLELGQITESETIQLIEGLKDELGKCKSERDGVGRVDDVPATGDRQINWGEWPSIRIRSDGKDFRNN